MNDKNIKNTHVPVLMKEIMEFIPKNKKINVIDATFGGGSYSKSLLSDFKINKLIAIDRDPITRFFSNEISNKYKKKFELINGCFSKIDELINLSSDNDFKKFDIIIFDLGLSSNQINDYKRGFSFQKDGPLNMNMGHTKKRASNVINNFSENEISDIIFNFGEERYARKIAKGIVRYRKSKVIRSTLELAEIISKLIPSKKTNTKSINPATKTFQALRIFVNDELNELKIALDKSKNLLNKKGKLIVVSFQSLEDRIVKDFFNRESGKRWRSSRHYPEIAVNGPITFKIITKKPIRPKENEISFNPRSRSAKLRVAEKIC